MLHGPSTATKFSRVPLTAAIAQRKAAADAAAAANGVNGVAGPSDAGDVEMAVVNGTSPAHEANGSAGRWGISLLAPLVLCGLDGAKVARCAVMAGVPAQLSRASTNCIFQQVPPIASLPSLE